MPTCAQTHASMPSWTATRNAYTGLEYFGEGFDPDR